MNTVDNEADVLNGIDLAAGCRVHWGLAERWAWGLPLTWRGAAVERSSHSSLEFIAFALLVTSDKQLSPVRRANGCGIVLPFVVSRAMTTTDYLDAAAPLPLDIYL